MRSCWLLLCLLLLPASAQAQSLVKFADVVRFSAAAQGAWYDSDAYPSDFEVGGTVAGSLQPHVSLVGGAFYGVGETYLRGSVGGRYCVTDPNDPNFSTHLGVQYHVSSNEVLRPQEWAGDVSVGWRPKPVDLPAIILVGQGSYGFESQKAVAYVGVRVLLGGVQ